VLLLSRADREKLVKLLGSEHAGERDNAALVGDRASRELGFTVPPWPATGANYRGGMTGWEVSGLS
jgi:hypothetical protein